MREVAAEFERPVLLFSGGKDSIVLLRLAEKAFRPAPFPFPVMHVDTGHNFPEAIEFRDRRVAETRRAADRGLGRGLDPARAGRRGDRSARLAQRAADRDPAGRDRRARLRRRVRRRAARRGARACEGAHPVLPRRVRPVGAPDASVRSCGASTMAASARASMCGSFRSPTGPSSMSGSTSPRRAWRCPSIYFAHEREVFARDGMLYAVSPLVRADGRRGAVLGLGALPDGGGHDLYRARSSPTPRRSRRSCSRSPPPRSPSEDRRGGMTGSPRPRWRTASGRGTSDELRRAISDSSMSGASAERARCHGASRPRRCGRLQAAVRAPRRAAALRHRRLGRRRQEHADRAPALRLQAGPRRSARARRADQPSGWATTSWTFRC